MLLFISQFGNKDNLLIAEFILSTNPALLMVILAFWLLLINAHNVDPATSISFGEPLLSWDNSKFRNSSEIKIKQQIIYFNQMTGP